MRDVYAPQGRGLEGDPQTTPRWKWHHPVHYSFPRGWEVVLQAPLTPQAQRLLLGLLAHLGWENQVTDSLARVGRKVGMHRNTATRALRQLEAWRLVAVDRQHPKLLRITVSPALVWQGKPQTLYKARHAFDERCRLSQHQQTDRAQHAHDTDALAAAASLPPPD